MEKTNVRTHHYCLLSLLLFRLIEKAALVATTSTDVINTNVAFTVRGLSSEVQIISTCNFEASEDILKLAGSNHVLRVGEIMGL
ncbi:NAD-binding protein [Pontibacter diazotrophicus]|uniref:NAD-binding protein n=1 Tax=Pontibacter diazotrophicus TaxID=1400979 RepID=UPI001FE5704E|nr:NAD-binding protein [Pontibacter diazotrophicus]